MEPLKFQEWTKWITIMTVKKELKNSHDHLVRDVVKLYEQGHPYKAISEALGISVPAARGIVYRHAPKKRVRPKSTLSEAQIKYIKETVIPGSRGAKSFGAVAHRLGVSVHTIINAYNNC